MQVHLPPAVQTQLVISCPLPPHLAGSKKGIYTVGPRVCSEVGFIYNLPYILKDPHSTLRCNKRHQARCLCEKSRMSPDLSQSFLPKCWRVEGEKHGLAVKAKETLQYLSSSLASEPRDSSIPGIRTLYLAL